MRLNQITGELIMRAVDIYLTNAYRNRPERQKRPFELDPQKQLPEILTGAHPFEILAGDTTASLKAQPVSLTTGQAPRMYAIRLGNLSYPHMKLAIVEAFFQDEFVFTVDRHDTFHFEPEMPGFQAWCELKELNRLVKDSIEDAWHKAGIPTLRGLRESRFGRPGSSGGLDLTASTVMILDDDIERAGVLKEILTRSGYAPVVGPAGPRGESKAIADFEAAAAKGRSVRLPPGLVPDAGNVQDLCALIHKAQAALIVLDISYRTGQGPRVAAGLRLDFRTQETPILGIYSMRDFGPDPDLFDAAIRRPYRTEALLDLISKTLVRRSPGGSGILKAVE